MSRSTKPHRIRVQTTEPQPAEPNKIRTRLFAHVEVWATEHAAEYIVCTQTEKHLEEVRLKLASAKLKEITGGSTSITAPPATPRRQPAAPVRGPHGNQGRVGRGGPPQRPVQQIAQQGGRKPYGFVPLPDNFPSAPPIWHDGTCDGDLYSGEVRFELTTLTPMLVGWERRKLDEEQEGDPWRTTHVKVEPSEDRNEWLEKAAIQACSDGGRPDQVQRYVKDLENHVVDLQVPEVGWVHASKTVLFPLRAPWGDRPVLIPGDTLKGLLRHEVGALLGAPMERVAEQLYSYRPNLRFPDSPIGRRLEPRLARVTETTEVSVDDEKYPCPHKVDVLAMATHKEQGYFPRLKKVHGKTVWANGKPLQENAPLHAEPYRGGMGGGDRFPSDCLSADARGRIVHTEIDVSRIEVECKDQPVGQETLDQYATTLTHYFEESAGHFSARHPNIGKDTQKRGKAIRAVQKAASKAFQVGDIIWVEWDTREDTEEEARIVSFGWHYYYRWAYQDSIRRRGLLRSERAGLCATEEEKQVDAEGAPTKLTSVRRLFGYVGDNDGSQKIGANHYTQLMGRVSPNAAIEVVAQDEDEKTRFLLPVLLKELGMPRPSAVEHYVRQPPATPRSDRAAYATYGDAKRYDSPGELAGRKLYLDRADAHVPPGNDDGPWSDSSESNRMNDRSTIAVGASRPGRVFRFTCRFRDLESGELSALLLALCPHQFRAAVGGNHPSGYCTKLGYARPLGWGAVRIEAKEILFLEDDVNGRSCLQKWEKGPSDWFEAHRDKLVAPCLEEWLGVHRHKDPEAGDYPRFPDQNGEIFKYHAKLRGEHATARRYTRG